MKEQKWIEIYGARQHNLKNIDLKIPKEKVVIVTGPSGSGKSSLAFNTLYAEGQRRYMESLSTYARQFLEKQEKPDVDDIKGLSPTIAIEQKNHTKNSRSTVGTATEIYDYLRLIFAKMGTMYSAKTGEVVKKNVVREVSNEILKKFKGERCYLLFPVEFSAKTKIQDRKLIYQSLLERGFTRVLGAEQQVKKAKADALDIQEEIQKKSAPALLGKPSKEHKVFVMADRLSVQEENMGRFEDALVQCYSESFGRARVLVADEDNKVLDVLKYTDYPSTGDGDERYPELTPHLFSFNSPMGACQTCKGFGNILKIDQNLVIPNPYLSISQGALEPLTKPSAKHWLKSLILFCQSEKISLNLPWKRISEKDQQKIWSGSGDFAGVEGMFEELEEEKYKMGVRVFLSRYRSPRPCPKCKGGRLRAEALHVKFHDQNIAELSAMTIEELFEWFSNQKYTSVEKETGKDIFPQILSRMQFLLRVGLDYLSLDRLAKTLSGGEAQRIALANQLGSRLTQTTYVLDEPSIGLHPKDTERLIAIMKDLRDLKNTVIVVEHDPDIIKNADYLIDLGPDAGEHGGQVIFAGPYENFLKDTLTQSVTQKYMIAKEAIPVPMRRRMERFKDRSRKLSWLKITGCKENNLKGVDLSIPIGMLTCVTGVSGSGKSSAVRRTLYPALAKIYLQQNEEVGRFDKISGFDEIKSVQMIDQEPIGRSPRSNPITFMKTFDEIRHLFSSTLEAKKKHYHAGHFSFNVPGGRCETCEGDGYMRVEMVFMEDLFLKCDVCEGKRYKKEILDIKYKGKNIDEVLHMTVSEAKRFFVGENRLYNTLETLDNVGLGYLRIGQPSNTLSGGESQRLKIARELAQQENNGVLYILDEPTTGLHFRDVNILIRVLHQLVERGNTVLVIEHNVDVMKTADWIIDFGPEGGKRGGEIVAEGTPEEVAKQKKAFTWKYLGDSLNRGQKVSVPELLKSP